MGFGAEGFGGTPWQGIPHWPTRDLDSVYQNTESIPIIVVVTLQCRVVVNPLNNLIGVAEGDAWIETYSPPDSLAGSVVLQPEVSISGGSLSGDFILKGTLVFVVPSGWYYMVDTTVTAGIGTVLNSLWVEYY